MAHTKSSNFFIKFLTVCSIALVAFFAALVSVFVRPVMGVVSAADSYASYGEYRIVNADGSVLVLTGEGYSYGSHGFLDGSIVNVYVVVEDGTRTATLPDGTKIVVPATFKDSNYTNWNYMVSSILDHGVSTSPTERISPLTSNGGSNTSGGYIVKRNCPVYDDNETQLPTRKDDNETQLPPKKTEDRYLVHSFKVNGRINIRAEFSYVQTTYVTTWFNSAKQDKLSFTHYAVNQEVLGTNDNSSPLSSVRMVNNTKREFNTESAAFFGWYSLANNEIAFLSNEDFYPYVVDTANGSSEVHLGALLFDTTLVKLATTTVSPSAGLTGGSAFVKVSNIAFGKDSSVTEYFLSNASLGGLPTESFAVSSEEYNLQAGSITLSAVAASGYNFIGFYVNGNLVSTKPNYSPSFYSFAKDDVIEARFASIVNFSCVSSTNGVPSSSVGSGVSSSVGGIVKYNSENSYNSLKKLEAMAYPGYTFMGFYVGNQKITAANATSLLGSEATFNANGTSLEFKLANNVVVEARFLESYSLTIATENVSKLFSYQFFNLDMFLGENPVIKIFVDNVALAVTSSNVKNSTLVLNIAKGAEVKLVINTASKMYNLNSVKCGQNVILNANISYSQNSATEHTHQFVLSQETSLTVSFNPYFITATVPVLNATLYVSAFPQYTDNAVSGVSHIYFQISPNMGYRFNAGSLQIGEYVIDFVQNSVVITAEELQSLNTGLNTSFSMIDLLKVILSTDKTSTTVVSTQDAQLDNLVANSTVKGCVVCRLVEVHSVNAVATSPELNQEISSEVVKIYQDTTLLGSNSTGTSALVENNTMLKFEADRKVNLNGKVYEFSYFAIDGAYLVGLSSPNNGTVNLALTSSTAAVAFLTSRSLTIVAVYREVVQVGISSQTNGIVDDSIEVLVNGEKTTNYQFALKSSFVVRSKKTNSFTHFVVTINGVSTIYTSSEISLVVERDMQVVAYHATKVETTPGLKNSSSFVWQANLVYLVKDSIDQYQFDNVATGCFVTSSESDRLHGQSVTLSATSGSGYTFVGYFKVNGELTYNNLKLLTNDNVFTIETDANSHVLALFAVNCVVNIASNAEKDLYINNQNVNTYAGYIGQKVTLEARDQNNFIGWYLAVNGNLVPVWSSSITEQVLSQDATFVAMYGNKSISVLGYTNGSYSLLGGSVTLNTNDGRQEFTFQENSTISTAFAYNTTNSLVLTAIANSGYKFLGWYTSATFADATLVSTSASLTLPAVESVQLYARFVAEYTLNVSAKDASGNAISGAISGFSGQSIYYGQQLIFTANNLPGYKYLGWYNSDNAQLSTDYTYIINSVSSNVNLVARYAKNINISASIIGQNQDANIIAPKTAFVGENVEIILNLGANSGKFLHFIVNGKEYNLASGVEKNGASYTLSITANSNLDIVAVLTNVTNLITNVTTLGGQNGQVGGLVQVSQNGTPVIGTEVNLSQVYTISAVANSGYRFIGFIVDGSFVPGEDLSNNILNLRVTTSTTITAVFAREVAFSVSISGNGQVFANGQKVANGDTLVAAYGETIRFTYSPDAGNALVSAVIDGEVYGTNVAIVEAIEDTSCKFTFAVSCFVQIVSSNEEAVLKSLDVYGSSLNVAGMVTASAPVTAKNGNVFVGFYKNGKLISPALYELNGSNVEYKFTAEDGLVIEARYMVSTFLYLAAAPENLTITVDGVAADWLLKSGVLESDRVRLVVPKNSVVELSTSTSGKWYFVVNNNTQNSTYVFNQVSTSGNFKFVAAQLSSLAPYVSLLFSSKDASNIDKLPNISLDNFATGTITPPEGKVMVGYRVQIGLEASKLWLTIAPSEAISVAIGANNIVAITDKDGVVLYHGYALRGEAVFAPNAGAALASAIKDFNNTNSSVNISGYIPSSSNPDYDYTNVVGTGTKVILTFYAKNADMQVSMPTLAKIREVFGSQASVVGNLVTLYLENVPSDVLSRIKNLSVSAFSPIVIETYTSSSAAKTAVTPAPNNNEQSVISVANGTKVTASLKNAQIDSKLGSFYQLNDTSRLVFDGWYNNGERVSALADYQFTATQSVSLEARFSVYYKITVIESNSTTTREYYVKENETFTVTATSSTLTLHGITLSSESGMALFVPASDPQIQNGVYSFVVLSSVNVYVEYSAAKNIKIFTNTYDNQNQLATLSGGSVFVNGMPAENSLTLSNTPVLLSAVANVGYVFGGWYKEVDDELQFVSTQLNYLVSAVDVSQATGLVAVFRKEATLNIYSNVNLSNISVTGSIGVGEKVTLSASPVSGYRFVGWFYLDDSVVSRDMTADYVLKHENSLRAVFVQESVVNVVVSGTGSATLNVSDNSVFDIGTTLNINASVSADSMLLGYKVNGVFVSKNAQLNLLLNSPTVTVELVVNKVASLPVTIDKNSIGIVTDGLVISGSQDVAIVTSNQVVVSDNCQVFVNQFTTLPVLDKVNIAVNSNQNITITGAGQYDKNQNVELSFSVPGGVEFVEFNGNISGTNDIAYVFGGWYNASGIRVSTESVYSFNATSNVQLYARFAVFYKVTLSQSVLGALTDNTLRFTSASGDQLDSASLKNVGSNYYVREGTSATIGASTESGVVLSLSVNGSWVEQDGAVLKNSILYNLTINSPVSISAVYASLVNLNVSISDSSTAKNGSFAVVSYTHPVTKVTYQMLVNGSSINTKMPYGAEVKIMAKAGTGSSFVGWTGYVSSTDALLELTLNQDVTLLAGFVESYNLKASAIFLDGTKNAEGLVSVHNGKTASIQLKSSVNGLNLLYLLYTDALGNEQIINLTDAELLKALFGSGAIISEENGVVTVSGMQLSESCEIIGVYKAYANVTLQFNLGNKKVAGSASFQSPIGDTLNIDSLVYGQTVKVTVDKEITVDNITYRFVKYIIKNVEDYNTTAYFLATNEEIVVEYAPVYTLNAAIVNKDFSPINVGSIFGNGSYLINQNAAISATLNNGYIFVGWYSADKKLLSTELNYVATNANQPRFAVVEEGYYLTVKASKGGDVFGSFISSLGSSASFLASGDVAVAQIPAGKAVTLTITAQNGYLLKALISTGNECQKGSGENEYIVTITENTTIEAQFAAQTYVSFTIGHAYKDAPDTLGSYVIDGNSYNSNQIFATLVGNSISFTLNTPDGFSAIVAVNGSVISPNSESEYIITASHSAYVSIVFAQEFTIDVAVSGTNLAGSSYSEAELKNQVSYYLAGSRIYPTADGKLTVLYGQMLSVKASPDTGYAFNEHIVNYVDVENNQVYNTQTIQVSVNNVTKIESVFGQAEVNLELYFPQSVRNFVNSTSPFTDNAQTIKMFVYVGSNLYAVVSNEIEYKTTDINEKQVTLNGDYLSFRLPYGYNQQISVAFGSSETAPTCRTIVSYNGRKISKASYYLDDKDIVNPTKEELVSSTQALVVSKRVVFTYQNYVLVDVTHNCNTPQTAMVKLTTESFNNINFTGTADKDLLVSSWVPVGSTVSVISTNYNGVTPYLAIYKNGLLSSIDFVKTWINSGFAIANRPTKANWTSVASDFESTSTSVTSFVATRDIGVIADYDEVFDVTAKQKVHAVGLNVITNGGVSNFANTSLSSKLVSHGGQEFSYSINSKVFASDLGYVADASVSDPYAANNRPFMYFVSTGALINGTIYVVGIEARATDFVITYYDLSLSNIERQTCTFASNASVTIGSETNGASAFRIYGVISGDNSCGLVGYAVKGGEVIDTNIQLLSSVASPTTTDLPTNKDEYPVILTIGSIDKKAGSVNTLTESTSYVPLYIINQNYNNTTSSAVAQGVSITADNMLRGARLKGFILVHNYQGNNISTDNIAISITGTGIYKQIGIKDEKPVYEKDNNFSFSSQSFISVENKTFVKSGTNNSTLNLPFVGGVQVFALYEKDIYIITPERTSMYKTDINGNVSIDGQSYSVVSDRLSENTSLPASVTHITRSPAADGSYYVYTSNTTNNGTIKGCLVFEAESAANINATVYHFGEFAGYEFSSSDAERMTSISGAELNSGDIKNSLTISEKALIEVNRDVENGAIPYQQQTLTFIVNQNLNMRAYFSTLRYSVTISFAEFINKYKTNKSDLEALFNSFNRGNNSTINTATGGVKESYYTLANADYYIKSDNISLIDGLIDLLNDNNEEILYNTYAQRNVADGSLKDLYIKFNVDARAGAGFSGFKLKVNTTKLNVSGNTAIYSPLEDSEKQTIKDSAAYAAGETVSDPNAYYEFNYNSNIGTNTKVEANEYVSLIKNPTIVIATNKNVAQISPTQIAKDDQEKKQDGNGDIIKTSTDMRQIILVKNANIYYNKIANSSQKSAFVNFMNVITPNPDSLATVIINFMTGNLMNTLEESFLTSSDQFKVFQRSFKAYLGAINMPLEVSSTKGEGDNQQTYNYFEIIPKLFEKVSGGSFTVNSANNSISFSETGLDEISLSSDIASIKIRARLNNGRYVTITKDESDGWKVVPDFITLDDGYTVQSISNGAITLKNGDVEQTTPLIIELSIAKESIYNNAIKLNDTDVKGYTLELYSCNTTNNILVDQDDLVLDRDRVNSQHKVETYVPGTYLKDGSASVNTKDWWILLGRPIKVDRAYDYFYNTSVSFSALANTANNTGVQTYLSNSGTGILVRDVGEGANKVQTQWSMWDSLYNNQFYYYITDSVKENPDYTDYQNVGARDNNRNGILRAKFEGQSRYYAYVYAFLAMDKQTCDAQQSIQIERKTYNGTDDPVIMLDKYNPVYSVWAETWHSFLVGLVYFTTCVVAAGFTIATLGSGTLMSLAIIGALTTIGGLGGNSLDNAIQEAATARVTRQESVYSQKSFAASMLASAAYQLLATI